MNSFIENLKKHVDPSLLPKVVELEQDLNFAITNMQQAGYPLQDIGIRTEEIPMDDPEVEMRGGLSLIFTCKVEGECYDIQDHLNYAEFVDAILNQRGS